MFQREGGDLHCEMPVSFATAALGGEIEIPTLDGHAKIKIPAETQTGQVFRLRSKGIKRRARLGHGDLFCHVAIETPVKLTARQKELLREFEAINDQDPGAHNPRAKSFMDKVREFFGPELADAHRKRRALSRAAYGFALRFPPRESSLREAIAATVRVASRSRVLRFASPPRFCFSIAAPRRSRSA